MVKHEIGHLPFEADITEHLKYGEENRITVLCDNALLANTIPQGKIVEVSRYNFYGQIFTCKALFSRLIIDNSTKIHLVHAFFILFHFLQ